jgi:lipopolysaccharide export LptBFGC system permease protein LptF
MNTLDELFLKDWLKPSLGALLTFVLLFLLVDIFGLVEDLINNWPGMIIFGQYLILRLGYAIFFLSPIAFLIGGFWMSHGIRRNQEWTVSLMSGQHPAILLRAPLVFLAIATIALTTASVWLMPTVSHEMNHLKDYTFEGKKPVPPDYHNIHLQLIDGRTMTIDHFLPSKNILRGIVIYNRSESKLLQRTDAQKASYRPGTGWILSSPTIRSFQKNTVKQTKRNQIIIPLVPPQSLARILASDPARSDRNPVEYFVSNLSQTIQFKERRHMNSVPEKIFLHWKFGFPLTNIVLGMFGFAIGLRTKLGRSAGIGVCLLTGFGYWILFSLSTSLGKSSYTTGLLSAYVPLLYVYLPALLFLAGTAYVWNRSG